jgi:hypothetical protein
VTTEGMFAGRLLTSLKMQKSRGAAGGGVKVRGESKLVGGRAALEKILGGIES